MTTESDSHRVSISVVEQSDGLFRASATLPSGATVEVLRKDRELSIRDASNACHRLAGEAGQRIMTILPYCQPDWSLAWWQLPQFRQFDLDDSRSEDRQVPPSPTMESDDGPVPIPLDFGEEATS